MENTKKSEEFITQFLKRFSNEKSSWKYEDGCILMGCIQMYQATGEKRYQDSVLNYLKNLILEDGTIVGYEKEKYNIDDINSGKALFYAYEWTGEEKYRKAIEILMNQLRKHPRTKGGNFWHKKIYPNQVWLDGLYMAQPFYLSYETKYNEKENYGDIVSQFMNVRKYIFNEEKGLYYHGYDESKEVFWSDKDNGKSPNFWIRAMGWYLMALIDVMEEMEEAVFEQYVILEELFREALRGILKYQDAESGLFFQVIDHPEVKENYLETSGSLMIGYAILKGCYKEALIKEKYQETGEAIIDTITETKLTYKDGILKLSDCCSVAGLGPQGDTRRDGSISYYLSEPIVCDDYKAVGAYMMAYAQKLLLHKENQVLV